MNKRSVIVALAGLNLFLLAALILSAYSPPAALAQGRGRAGDFQLVTVQIREDGDLLAVINNQTNEMHFFTTLATPKGAKLNYAGGRDLNHDFGRR